MDFNMLLGFLQILKKSIKIVTKNGRLVAIVTSIYLIIVPLFFLLNLSTIKPIVNDLFTKAVLLPSLDPRGLLFAQVLVTIQKDVKSFFGFELVFLLTLFLTSLFACNAIILLTGASYNDEKISHKDLILRMPRSFIRLFVTSFQVTLLRVGFLYIGFIALMVPAITVFGHKIMSKVILWVLVILISSLYLYFSVVWVLSLVVSVLEECSGIEALGKAARLVKGKKLDGFLLNILVNLLSYPFFQGLSKLIVVKQSYLTQAVFLFFLMSCICFIIALEFQAYTVLYLECKKSHNEEIELHGSIKYTEITKMPLESEDLP
ncbi:hypothetical protein L1987_21095 [Smallanthus sonchifolius]|uniref:Uncharacterized protein n=1 Tax=Smallanthus sonchifolius TaxID=185202 RepID=A0ACB9ISX9_9ASTR|nr:hypothetical protein L1987_21095 [Smallanthus sonchifolius]